ncbi:enterotoxin [Bacillus clarus]|uniref:Enterotoxin n=1 Tax=Bacillus clarus TaxID=2338372 RepID=A0A090YAD0_9BACI|nr:HBL/NHE enterotoxin family protein [Bacillus clarus]KFM95106.1 hemolytic enterotoxin family protein [Bacillus clarus]RFT62675.1 enterotoxin [Bacillus clarus]
MNKKLYMKIALSMAITGMATSSVMPLHTFAAEKIGQSQQQESNNKYSLGPEGFKEVIGKMTANTLVMDSYAQTLLLKQQQTDLSGISSINGDLRAGMIKHQKDAQANALYWINDINPHIMKNALSIVDYNTVFQSQYDNLLVAIDQKSKEKLQQELRNLHQNISDKQLAVDDLLGKLKTFRNELVEDTNSFKDNSNRLTSILESTNAGIPFLQQQINNYNYLIKQSNDMIIMGGVFVLFTFGASIAMIATAKSNISSAEQEIQKLQSRISGAQQEVAILTDAKNKTVHMTETIDTAITALQNISNQWHTIGSKYSKLLDNVEKMSPDEFAFIKEDLNTARDSWQEIKNFVDELSAGAEKTK